MWMLINQILKAKGDTVFTVSPSDTVAQAAALLDARRVGALVVSDDKGGVAGIISERDIVRVLARTGASALAGPISACMTADVIFAEPTESVDALLSRMTDRRIRHLPVCFQGKLLGIVSIGDLVKTKIAETEAEARSLKAYITAG
jgi:CBS domain-containing protein